VTKLVARLIFSGQRTTKGASLTTVNTLTKREAADVFGLEDPRLVRIRRLSQRQIEASKAASSVAREQGLRKGVVVKYEGERFVVVAAYLTRIGLQHPVNLWRYRNPPVVYWDEIARRYLPTVSVVHLPRPGYIHIQSFRYNHSSILNANNCTLKESIAAKLSLNEWYENEFGRFWLESAAVRALGELERTAELEAVRSAEPEPEPAEPLETFCAKCGQPFIDDDQWRRSKRCPTCRVGSANMGKDASTASAAARFSNRTATAPSFGSAAAA
jgi:hypothetical protein